MNIYEQQASNRRTTVLIMAAFTAFFLVIGLGFDYFYLNFGQDLVSVGDLASTAYQESVAPGRYQGGGNNVPFGTILALLVSAGLMLNSYFNGARMVLRSTMARRADPLVEGEKRFINVVAEMATASGLPAPAAYIIPDQDLNAFATGTSPANSVIAVTEGLLASLNREELQAVVAHEMGHVRNYDIRLMTVVAALMGAIALLSDFAGRSSRYRTRSSYRGASAGGSGRRSGRGGAVLLFLLWIILVMLAPLISRILAMAISRQREFLADATGAELTRNPAGLISALEKIRAAVTPTNAVNNGVAHMCIADPRGSLIEERSGFAADLLATHPPMEKRILALKAMAYRSANPAPVRGM
ncbi:MAG: zinc metalloprotease HtpX [Elusimicrobia bacterium HGW-Elusimicrobia-3]|nr:MAG: zinc metalloprotease HtpX [Elusimicrobia bacterium HGW-Elusimicrobia-3]